MNHNILNLLSLFILTLSTLPSSSLSLPSLPSLPHFFPNISSIPHSNLSAAWDSFHALAGCHSGDQKPGLAKLKQYFHSFGYLTISNFSDNFDDSLEAAIKTYQLNFNLNSTGELDDSTLTQILQPRCGVADIVNGTTTMKSNSNVTKRRNLGVVKHYSFFSGSPRWGGKKSELTFAFLPENRLDESVKAVFATAFDRWAEVTPLTFRETASYSQADIKIGFYSRDHGDGEPFDGVLGTLGHAFSPPSGHLHLDGDENWVINGEILRSPAEDAVDLESVVVHEIGHLLGLGHSSVESAIMFPSISSGVRRVELAGDDIEGVQALYGSGPGYSGSPNPTLEESDTNGAGIIARSFFMGSLSLSFGILLMNVL
ncbi:hypothetical protein DCAR_0936062 [Daucus carota subsp. sativus]|uniref:Peptidase metallopeptidase domain-containing protein n=1 Tax=Daucus carota subsp. sativus TaxID=79200 RepID=A0A175YKZ9_DAUCS|nr:PREDICTED: metalloendoproteinase 5-MMP-like [Daucus carota subsp. sativus]WOH16507.1 hypothetical protein DCAR_0936062 [Daucus carota subsp. sativus]